METRREFIKKAAPFAGIAVLALAGCTPNDAINEDMYVRGTLYLWDGNAYVAAGGAPPPVVTLSQAQVLTRSLGC